MADIADVCTALATRISTGLAGSNLSGRVSGYAPDSIVTPWAICLPAQGDFVTYDVTMNGQDDFSLVVKVLVGTEITRTAQAELLSYLARSGSKSIRGAIYGDRTLGGTVADVRVVSAQSYNDIEWAGIPYLGAEIAVTAYS